jgi:hypothetical protein
MFNLYDFVRRHNEFGSVQADRRDHLPYGRRRERVTGDEFVTEDDQALYAENNLLLVPEDAP